MHFYSKQSILSKRKKTKAPAAYALASKTTKIYKNNGFYIKIHFINQNKNACGVHSCLKNIFFIKQNDVYLKNAFY